MPGPAPCQSFAQHPRQRWMPCTSSRSVLALEERQKQLVELCERQVRRAAGLTSWLQSNSVAVCDGNASHVFMPTPAACALGGIQVSEARADRDEEAARCRQEVAAAASDAARQKAEVIAGGCCSGSSSGLAKRLGFLCERGLLDAGLQVCCSIAGSLHTLCPSHPPTWTGYERQVTAATASEREARQRAAALAEENEHVRSSLQRAEARVAEQELAMQRMVAQFEGALATLQQLEAQYDGLAADAGAADRLRAARIAELEAEVEGLRASRAGLQQERDGAMARLEAAAAAAEAEATHAKQQYHRAMMDAAELTEALSAARSEAHQQRQRAEAAEEAAAVARASAAAAQQAAERESSSHARTQGLLEAARLHHEAARRDGAEQEALAAQLREAAAVLEAERNDLAKAAEAAEAKVQ